MLLDNPFQISNFAPAPRDDPMAYPGKRPLTSFLFNQNSIFPIKLEKNVKLADSKIMLSPTKKISMQSYFEEQKTTKLEDRYMIIGYGSNINPPQLSIKFRDLSAPIPVLKAELKGYDVVYASLMAPYGSIPATLEKSEHALTEVWANMLTEEQLKIMDKSEGRGIAYWLVEIDDEITFENGEKFSPLYMYLSAAGVLSVDNSPARLGEIRSKDAQFHNKTEKEILNYVLNQFGSTITFDNFIKKVKDDHKYRKLLNEFLAEKLSLKSNLNFKIIENGKLPAKKLSQMQI